MFFRAINTESLSSDVKLPSSVSMFHEPENRDLL